MNHYSVLCILNKPNELESTDVFAESVIEAENLALKKFREQGYLNVRLAPNYPEAPVVIELNDKQKYEVTLLAPSNTKMAEITVKVLGRNIDEAIANAITLEEFSEVYGCVVSTDSFGKPKVSKGWR